MRYQTLLRSFLFPVLAIVAGYSPQRVLAHGGGGDIAVFTSNGRAEVAFTVLDEDDIEQIEFDASIRAFHSILLPQPAIPGLPDFGSSEPGYDANEGDLPGNALLEVNILSLEYWNGSSPDGFAPALGVNPTYTSSTANVEADGGFHAHLLFGLTDTTADALPLPEGIYLATLSLSVDELTDSHPFQLVTLVDDLVTQSADPEGDAEAIGELVRAYLEDPAGAPAPTFGGKDFTFYANAISSAQAVPEPSSLLLLSLAILGCMVFHHIRK